jgi:hypothetical protein
LPLAHIKRQDKALDNPETKAGLLTVARNVDDAACSAEQKHTDVATEKIHTLGAGAEQRPPHKSRRPSAFDHDKTGGHGPRGGKPTRPHCFISAAER